MKLNVPLNKSRVTVAPRTLRPRAQLRSTKRPRRQRDYSGAPSTSAILSNGLVTINVQVSLAADCGWRDFNDYGLRRSEAAQQRMIMNRAMQRSLR
jgi:hypothetical protein